jgi:hypothetical protein
VWWATLARHLRYSEVILQEVPMKQYRKPKLAKAAQLRTCAQRAKDDPKRQVPNCETNLNE